MATAETPNLVDRPRGGNGQFVASLSTAERDAEAARLRARGMTFAEIARRLGMQNRGVAEKAVKRALAKVTSPAVEELRKSQQTLLDLAKTHVLDVLESVHPMVSNGHVVGAGCTPEHAALHPLIAPTECYGPPIRDDGPRLAAVTTLVRLLDRESKLHGADSPVKVEREENGTVRIEIKGIDADKL